MPHGRLAKPLRELNALDVSLASFEDVRHSGRGCTDLPIGVATELLVGLIRVPNTSFVWRSIHLVLRSPHVHGETHREAGCCGRT